MFEEFYIIATKGQNGEWNKFAKAYDMAGTNAIPFFWNKDKAIHFLNNNIDGTLRKFFAVFQIVIDDNHVTKVFDGQN